MRSADQPGPTGRPFVRPYRSSDLPQVYDICVRTADAGGDARGQYSDDRLMGDLFAAPYVTLEPDQMLVPELAGHPAHLHIDLLPAYQGRCRAARRRAGARV